jgi:hypothetical protein
VRERDPLEKVELLAGHFDQQRRWHRPSRAARRSYFPLNHWKNDG